MRRTSRSAPPTERSAAVAKQRLRLLMALAGLLLPALAHAQQLGDFDRKKPGVLNDDVLPALEYFGKVLTNQPHSTFALTAVEEEMHNRVWRFLVAPQSKGWAFEYGPDIRKARADASPSPGTEKYYRWLSRADYESAAGRYGTLHMHVEADVATAGPVFDAICAVIEVDRRRELAASELTTIDAATLKNQRGRAAENLAYEDRFVAALTFRYASYSYALDHLLVETPDPRARDVDASLSDLAGWVDRAQARDFCSGATGARAGQGGGIAIRSRTLIDAPSEGEFRK